MRILISNDDGIHAPGLETLIGIAETISDDIWVVAPETNQSGAAHSLTIRRPLRMRELGERRFAVDGTPTDCVLVALRHLLRGKPVDLMLSGINHGTNLGEDVTYSGTVAAAMEATLFGIRSIALSQDSDFKSPVKWQTAAHWGAKAIQKLMPLSWERGVLMNVNMPDLGIEDVSGIDVTEQGQRQAVEHLVARQDPFGFPYYWIGSPRSGDVHEPGSDLDCVERGRVSITPIALNMTHGPSVEHLRREIAG